jgi:hypothetical protein
MSKDVAVIGIGGEVVAVNVQADEYEPQPYEIVVTGMAWVGGTYVGGYFYPLQPFPSWTRKEGQWVPPKPRPESLGNWVWNEEAQEWQD